MCINYLHFIIIKIYINVIICHEIKSTTTQYNKKDAYAGLFHQWEISFCWEQGSKNLEEQAKICPLALRIKMTPDFSTAMLKSSQQWNRDFRFWGKTEFYTYTCVSKRSKVRAAAIRFYNHILQPLDAFPKFLNLNLCKNNFVILFLSS